MKTLKKIYLPLFFIITVTTTSAQKRSATTNSILPDEFVEIVINANGGTPVIENIIASDPAQRFVNGNDFKIKIRVKGRNNLKTPASLLLEFGGEIGINGGVPPHGVKQPIPIEPGGSTIHDRDYIITVIEPLLLFSNIKGAKWLNVSLSYGKKVVKRTFNFYVVNKFPESVANPKIVVYPSPFKNNFNLDFNVTNSKSKVTLDIQDIFSGHRYVLLNERSYEKGKHTYTYYDLRDIPSGTYYYVLKIDNETYKGKIIKNSTTMTPPIIPNRF